MANEYKLPFTASDIANKLEMVNTLNSTKLDASELPSAIDTALAEAKASGEFDGEDGNGIASIKQTTTSTADDGNNIFAVTLTNGTTATFTVQNGSKGSKGETGATGAAGKTPVKGVDYFTEADKAELVEALTDTLPENETLIANVVEQVPMVKVAEQPEFVNDLSECTDTSKMYVLSNGHLAAYMTTTVTTEGSTVPNFTNIYNPGKGAYIKNGYRYSASSAEFKACATDCSVVVPIDVTKANTNVTIRARGVTLEGTAYPTSIYIGADNQTFGTTGRGGTTNSTDANGDVIITIFVNDPAYAKYAIFHVAAGVDAASLIVTQDEEITYTTTEGSTEIITEWTDTDIEYNQPPDYTDRVLAVEKKTAKLRSDVDTLEKKVNNNSGGASTESGGTNVFAFAAYPPPAPAPR